MRRVLPLVAVLATLSLNAADLPVTQVVVFKNGIGFVTRSGEVEFHEGGARIGRLPSATYGGLWVAAGRDGLAIEEAVARQESVPATRSATSIPELLDANDGRNVTVGVSDRELSGMLRSKPDSSYVILEERGSATAVAKSDVRSLRADGNLGTKKRIGDKESVLELRSSASGMQPVSIASLERGIGWTPEYEVMLIDDHSARVSLRAALINDVADLDGAEVSFAVGYPSFEFAEIRNPLDPTQTLSQFLQSLSMGSLRRPSGPMANVMTQGVSVSGSATSGMPELPDTLAEGEQQQDLYLYRKDGVSLKAGERGAFALMSTTVPYTHTWNWVIEDHPTISPYGYMENRPSEGLRDQVWHAVRLENRAKAPWTTGPALVIEQGKPIAQNTLHYTPSGASTRLRLTVATDIVAEHFEVEKARVAEPLRKFGTTYEGIDYEGTLTIRNHRGEAVEIDVTRTLTGTVMTAGEGGESVRLAEEPSAVNPRSKIDWSVSVGANQTKLVAYQYRVWVRR